MFRVRVRLGYTMTICLVLQHQVSTEKKREFSDTIAGVYADSHQ